MKFKAAAVYDWLFRFLEPLPKNAEEFMRLVAVFTRRLGSGHAFEELLGTYGEDLCALLGAEQAPDDGGDDDA
jgi:hypothetical protein